MLMPMQSLVVSPFMSNLVWQGLAGYPPNTNHPIVTTAKQLLSLGGEKDGGGIAVRQGEGVQQCAVAYPPQPDGSVVVSYHQNLPIW